MSVMKKILTTIGILMFLGGALQLLMQPMFVFAEEEDSQDQSCNVLKDPTCRVSSRIEYALREKGNKGLDWGDSFGATDPKDVGQNLYLMIYEKTQSATVGDAVQATAEQYGMPPARMLLILGGDITPILERAPQMRVEEAIDIYNEIVETYAEKQEILKLGASINAKVEPSEMFANGDVGDSGFDLINDLDNIEIILFQKAEDTTIGGPLSSSAGGGEDEETGTTEQPLETPGEIPIDLGASPGATDSEKAKSEGATGNEDSAVENPFEDIVEDKSSIFGGGVNPNQCFASTALDDALNDFAKEASENPKLQSTYTKSGDAADTSDASTRSGTSTGTGTGSDLDIPVPTPDSPSGLPPVLPAPADDYTTPSLCEDIVCLSFDFVLKPATPAFDKTDNCIQCHVQYINASLQKTISHSLIPSKATGNLGESGMCKNAAGTALGSIGMNLSLNVVPIITPPKDDLVTLGNIGDEWDKYAEKNGAWNYNEKERRRLEAEKAGKEVVKTPVQKNSERMLTIALLNSPAGASLGSVLNETIDANAAQTNKESQEQLVAEIAKDAYGEVDAMKALDDEMKQMNKFFDGFKKQFLTLLDDVPGLMASKACVKLNDKQECT